MLKCCEERFKSKNCALSHLKCEIVASTKYTKWIFTEKN